MSLWDDASVYDRNEQWRSSNGGYGGSSRTVHKQGANLVVAGAQARQLWLWIRRVMNTSPIHLSPHMKGRPQMSHGPCHTCQRHHFWYTLLAIVALVGALFGALSAHAEPAHAAGMGGTPPNTAIDQVKASPATYHPTPAQAAYVADKVQLSNEYDQRVLTGKEPLATFEAHERAFMVKWNLGGEANLHTALTKATARLLSSTKSAPSPRCIIQPGGGCIYPVYQVQFPEESYNWCGPATLSTTLIEDSFAWPGANTYNGETLIRNQYVVSQQNSDATSDELWLASNGVISGNVYNNGTSIDQMNTMANHFVNGHGGNYAEEPITGTQAQQIADFKGKVESDIGTGWDVPTAIDVAAYYPYQSMPGYPVNYPYEINHWVPVTQISSDGNTTYYSDPIYGSPDYKAPTWNIPAPYESTSTTNIVWFTNWILW